MCYQPGVLRAHLDGELLPQESMMIRQHLELCDPCRQQMAALAAHQTTAHGAFTAVFDAIPTDVALARWRARYEDIADRQPAPVWHTVFPVRHAGRGSAVLSSVLLHGAALAAVLLLGSQPAVLERAFQLQRASVPLQAYVPKRLQTAQGGGGGGDRSQTLPAQGMLPKAAPRQFTPPQQVILNEHPKLAIEPTIDAHPDLTANLAQYGNPLDRFGLPSNGTGMGGGIGAGAGGGVGAGNGPGFGPGNGGNFGGGVYRIGDGVSQPVLVYKADPEYSEEARKAKFQGTVTLAVIVDSAGRVTSMRVMRALGLGLDEKAMEAVQKWRFRPARKDGHAVSVQAIVEVNFRLL